MGRQAKPPVWIPWKRYGTNDVTSSKTEAPHIAGDQRNGVQPLTGFKRFRVAAALRSVSENPYIAHNLRRLDFWMVDHLDRTQVRQLERRKLSS
jgi:hypothetical protein